MNSNRPFTDADGSFIDADPAGGICESLLNCLTGETSATRSIEIGNKQDKGQIPPSKPCTTAASPAPDAAERVLLRETGEGSMTTHSCEIGSVSDDVHVSQTMPTSVS